MNKQSRHYFNIFFIALLVGLTSQSANAHDPVSGFGPHVVFKDGLEVSPDIDTGKAGSNRETQLGLEITYGITGDWAAGFYIPYYVDKSNTSSSVNGQGDLSLFTKYRIWRKDSLGLQQSIAIAAKLVTTTIEFFSCCSVPLRPINSGPKAAQYCFLIVVLSRDGSTLTNRILKCLRWSAGSLCKTAASLPSVYGHTSGQWV